MATYSSDLKFTDALEREMISKELDDFSLGGAEQIDETILRLIVVSSILVAAVLAMVLLA